MNSYEPPHMVMQKQDNQHEHTFSNYVRIQDVVQKTCLRRWTTGKSGERGSGISVLPARYDNDDSIQHYSFAHWYDSYFGRRENSQFKPVRPHFKKKLCHVLLMREGLGKYIYPLYTSAFFTVRFLWFIVIIPLLQDFHRSQLSLFFKLKQLDDSNFHSWCKPGIKYCIWQLRGDTFCFLIKSPRKFPCVL